MQAGLVNLLVEIQQRLQVAYLFIAHDLAVVRTISSRVAVMYLGAVVETGSTEEVFARPAHPYTRALLSAVPVDDPADRGRRERIILRGEVPRPTERVVGCRFRSRCYRAEEVCATVSPPLAPVDGSDHDAACLFAAADELVARTG